MDREEIENRFGYHPPRSTARVRDHEFARGRCKDLAFQLSRLLPEGREKSLVLTKLEEAMFWANASLARAHDPDAAMSKEEAAAGPRVNLLSNRLGQGEPTLDYDEERDPREALDPDEQLCTAPVADHEQCAEPAVGYVVLPGQRRPLCRYHLVQDDSGGAIERFR